MRFSSPTLLIALGLVAMVPLILFISRGGPESRDEMKEMATFMSYRPSMSETDKPVPVPVSPDLWRQHVQDTCERLGFDPKGQNDLVPTMFRKILVDDKYKLIYCQIPKVATTTWRRLLIFLSGKLNITDPLNISSNDAHHKYDKYIRKLGDFSMDEIKYRLDNYFKFVIVREPYERLLSAFRNKFEAKTASADYFRKAFGRKIIAHFRENPTDEEIEVAKDVKFEEFVDYLIDPNRFINMNEHWERFHKLCHPCLINYNFIGKLSTIQTDSQYILDQTGASKQVKFPSRSESRYAHKDTNSYMMKYYSQLSRTSLLQLHEMYRADFEIFNFTIPEVIAKLMN